MFGRVGQKLGCSEYGRRAAFGWRGQDAVAAAMRRSYTGILIHICSPHSHLYMRRVPPVRRFGGPEF
jgi:hypothetical protein